MKPLPLDTQINKTIWFPGYFYEIKMTREHKQKFGKIAEKEGVERDCQSVRCKAEK